MVTADLSQPDTQSSRAATTLVTQAPLHFPPNSLLFFLTKPKSSSNSWNLTTPALRRQREWTLWEQAVGGSELPYCSRPGH
ncbi:hypothetical protein H8959_013529 [Pygathrix nigripes]